MSTEPERYWTTSTGEVLTEQDAARMAAAFEADDVDPGDLRPVIVEPGRLPEQ